MAIPIVGGLLSAGLGAVETVAGFFNKRKAKKALANMKELDYSQSDAYKTAESSANLAGRYAQEGLPEQSLRFQEDMIGRSGAASLASAGSLRQGTIGLGATATGLADQYRGLAAMDAQQRVSNRGQYFTQLQNLQGQQAQDFDYQMGYDMLKRSQQLGELTAGQGMINNGLSALTNTAGGYAADIFQLPTFRQSPIQANQMNSLPAGQIPVPNYQPQLMTR